MSPEITSEESGDIRRKALVRLGVAGIVTALALAALWWLDHSGKPPAKPKPASPAPIVTAPVQVPTPGPQLTEEPKPLTTPEPTAPEPQQPPVSAPAEKPSAPPPPSVSNAPARTAVSAPPATRHEPAPTATTAPPATPPAPAATHPPASQTTTASNFAVQVGVFSNPDNANELVARLKAAGIHAYAETRVQVGPFASRAEAEKARTVLDRMGIKGLIGPAAARK